MECSRAGKAVLLGAALMPSFAVAQADEPADDTSRHESQQQEETSAESPSAQHMDTGQLIGPQPGPDSDVPELRNPYSEDANAIADGQRLFAAMNCAGCHGTHAGGGMGPSLRDVTWLYGREAADIYNSIAEGRRHGMPAWGLTLPADTIWKITAYIETLGTSLEPDPPPENPSYPNPPSEEAGNERMLESEDADEDESNERE